MVNITFEVLCMMWFIRPPPPQVHISTEEEQTTEGERTVTLTGTPESVLLAQFLVQSNVDLFKKDQAS